jgi:hypothetical protein
MSTKLSPKFHALLWKASIGYNDSWSQIDPEVLNTFGKLIVQECAKFVEDNSGYDDCNNAWHPEPEELLKHFGIE